MALFIYSAGNIVADSQVQKVVFSSGKAEIIMEDHLYHPFYWWPNALFSYPIIFNEEVPVTGLILIYGQTDKQLPFQITGLEKTPDGKSKNDSAFINARAMVD